MEQHDEVWWSNWLRENILESHRCPENTHDDVGVLRHGGIESDTATEPAGWMVAITWVAEEEDVAAGKAPEAGDILSASSVRINFCPFCGVKL